MQPSSKESLKSLSTKFSIRNFITDLPRMLNESFKIIYDIIVNFWDPDTSTLNADKIESTYINTTTLVAQNFRYTGSDGNVYDYGSLVERIDALEAAFDRITFITKEQIDTLNATIYPNVIVSQGQTVTIDSSLGNDTIVWESFDTNIATVDSSTNQRYAIVTGVAEGTTTVLASSDNGSKPFYVQINS